MKNKLTKSNVIIAQRGVSLVAVFAVLVVSLLAVLPLSYGWFAEGKTATATGMQTQIYKTDFEVTYGIVTAFNDDGSPVTPEDFFDITGDPEMFRDIKAPGDTVAIQIKIVNKGKYTVKLSQFGIETPTELQEQTNGLINPATNADAYLSTELTTRLVAVTDKDGKALFPVPSSATNHYLRASSVTSVSSIPRIDYIADLGLSSNQSVTIEPNGEIYITIQVKFENTDKNQNVFKNFAANGGVCKRSFFFTYEDQFGN